MQTEYQTLWNKCLAVIKDIVPEAAFNTWFKPIIPLSYEDNKFTIQVPSQFFYEYLEEKYVNVLKVTLYRVIGQGTILNYRIKVVDKVKEDGMITLPTGNDAPRTGKKSADIPSLFESKARQDWDSHLNPKYNFDNYFEGTSNRLVRSSSEAIAQEPGKTFNPMFVFGASGVGKTHLCHAIGNRIQEIHPEKKVLYISAHLFTVQYTEAIRKNTTNDFMYFYQGVDVLILDEPTAGLDPAGRDEILGLVSKMHRELGITILLVSHSMEDVAEYVDRIIVMNHGAVMFDALPKQVFAHYKELEAVGLAAPQVTYLVHELAERGLPVDTQATTAKEAAQTILSALREKNVI